MWLIIWSMQKKHYIAASKFLRGVNMKKYFANWVYSVITPAQAKGRRLSPPFRLKMLANTLSHSAQRHIMGNTGYKPREVMNILNIYNSEHRY